MRGQERPSSCGPVSAAVVAAAFGQHVTEHEIARLSDGRDGTSLQGLASWLRTQGFRADLIVTTPEQISVPGAVHVLLLETSPLAPNLRQPHLVVAFGVSASEPPHFVDATLPSDVASSISASRWIA